jgi:DNA-binding transcriptional ArsR family regulator
MKSGTAAQAECDPQAAAEFLRALAHPMRLQILGRLLDGELAVAGFETELGLRQPNLSQQLGQLREAGLVETRREAKSIFYRLADDKVRIILDALREVFASTGPKQAPRKAKAPPPAAIRLAPRPASRNPAPLAPASGGGECGVFSVAGWSTDTNRR